MSVSSDILQDEFELEVLRSEKLRVTIVIWFVVAAVGLLIVTPIFLINQFQAGFHGRFRIFQLTVIPILILVLLYLLFERLLIVRHIRLRKKLSRLNQLLNAFIEVSLPTAGMVGVAILLGPIYALVSPMVFWYAPVIVLSALRLDFKISVFTGSVAAIEYLAIARIFTYQPVDPMVDPFLVAIPQHLIKAILLFATGLMTGFVTSQIQKRLINSFRAVEERNRISRTFGQHVSPEVMQKLLTDEPDRLSEQRYVCIMFLDIRGFTAFAEQKRPEEVVAYLDSLFEFMIEIVNRHNGIINKFLGDGFMAVFGAPLSDGRENINAVSAAREILARVADEVVQGNVLPTTVGIGLHSGEAVTGRIGSAMRQEYTVIGDVVNLASRIEQLNKQFASQLLVSEEVWRAVGEDAAGATRIGETQVKGRTAPIQIYKLA